MDEIIRAYFRNKAQRIENEWVVLGSIIGFMCLIYSGVVWLC